MKERIGEMRVRQMVIRRLGVVLWLLLWGVSVARGGEPYTFHFAATPEGGIRVTMEVLDFVSLDARDGRGNARTAFHMVGVPNTMERGYPSLPYIAELLPLRSEGARVRIIEAEYEELATFPPIPSRGTVVAGSAEAQVPVVEGTAYEDTVVWPREVAQLRVYGGEEERCRVLMYPFRYDPRKKRVELARKIVVEVTPVRGATKASRMLAGGEVRWRGENRGRGSMLVIYAKEFGESLEDFLHFKRMSGLTVETASYDANEGGDLRDTAEIRKYVKRQYEAKGKDLRYVLLVGSFKKLPSERYEGVKNKLTVSDWLYSPVTPRYGKDQVSFGRLPAETQAELQLMLSKVLSYERGELSAGERLNHALGIASGESEIGYAGRTDAQQVEFLAKMLQDGGYASVAKELDNPAGTRVTSREVIKRVEAGVGLINYVGHGYPSSWKTSGMTTAEALGLKNRDVWPFVLSVACDNGRRSGPSPSFAEGWLLAHDGEAPTGAIAFTGATREIVWEEPMLAQERINMLLLQQGSTSCPTLSVGDAFTHGLIKMMEAYGDDWGVLQSADVWHLFGDPSLLFRSSLPRRQVGSWLPRLLVEGMTELPVQCADDGSVVTLCRKRAGSAPRYVSAISEGGRASLTGLDLHQGDEVEIAVVRANCRVLEASGIPVLPRQNTQLLSYTNVIFKNSASAGVLKCGEEVELALDVVNASGRAYGEALALRLEVTPSGALELLPGSSALRLPPLAEGASLNEPLRFSFRVNAVDSRVSSVRVRLLVDGAGGERVLADRLLPYQCDARDEFRTLPEHSLLIDPNPSSGAVRLRVREGIAGVRVFTMLGLPALAVRVDGRKELTLGMHNLSNGVYLILVESVDGTVYSQKVALVR